MATIFISAGEVSSDMHGANLIGAVRERAPETRFIGLGRRRMAEAGLEALQDMTRHSVMFFDAFTAIPRLFRLLGRCRDALRRERPDAVVLIDYVGFNLFLAKAAHELGIPVVYYVAPQLWAHGEYRVVKLRKWIDRVLVIYPFEEPFYRERDIPVTYVGHPLFDHLAKNPSRAEVIDRVRAEYGPAPVAVMPGSRVTEVRRHAPVLARALRRIHRRFPEVRFVAPDAGDGPAAVLSRRSGLEVHPVDATVPELAAASALCLVKSGTTTLEVAAAGCPMVVFYRVSPLAGFISRGLRSCPYISLVNALAGRGLVPERLMVRDDARWLADRAAELLDPVRAGRTCAQLAHVMLPYARPGASVRAADAVLAQALGDEMP
jgi:lipid-A-disaccharide synthase